jgi:hypothetical protein
MATPAPGAAGIAVTGAPVKVVATGGSTVMTTDSSTTTEPCWANLNAGKPLPGPDEWRALERRASLFRLR